MEKDMRFDGVILNARMEGDRVSGRIYCDRNERFHEGEFITTSSIVKRHSETVIQTRNSTYKVMWGA